MEPRTVWQEQAGVQSGGGGMVRSAAFAIGDGQRGGVTLTVQVPDGFYAPINGGGMSATLLITPDEARAFASWLTDAAEAADQLGPPLYP